MVDVFRFEDSIDLFQRRAKWIVETGTENTRAR